MVSPEYTIRRMTRRELDIAVGWAAAEGWNPGLHDAEVFWQTDSEGFIALDKDGEMIGSGSIVSYDGEFGFMGFFILKPAFRGRGLGAELWYYRRDALLSRLKEGAAIGMDGVFAMQPFYAKGGFVFSHRDLRMESVAREYEYGPNVHEVAADDFEAINDFDRRHFGFDRSTFLRGWLNMDQSRTVKYAEEGELKGYGVIRKCVTGYKIGPLFAESYEIADDLFRALSAFAAGDLLYLDIPEINEDAVRLAGTYGMKEMFGCARMYYGTAPGLPHDQIFGVTTFELG